MNPLNPFIHIVAVSALAFGLPALAQTAPAAKQEAVAIKMGDTWTFSHKNYLEANKSQEVKVSVVSVAADRWAGKSVGTVTGESEFERGHDWRVLSITTGGNKREFKPAYLEFGFPLELGKSFKGESTFPFAQGGMVTNKYDSRIVAMEKITVGGVALDTWVIETTGWWQLGSNGGRLTNKAWYSPAARSMVKVEFKRWTPNARLDDSTLTELTSFKLAD